MTKKKQIRIPSHTIVLRGQLCLPSTSEERPFTIAMHKIIKLCGITPTLLLSPCVKPSPQPTQSKTADPDGI